MTTKEKASEETKKLVKALVKQAYDEGIGITELTESIRNYRNEIIPPQKSKKPVAYYRNATEEEELFRTRVHEFLLKEISLEEFPFSGYEVRLLEFSEVLLAAKMLQKDKEKITMESIFSVLWNRNMADKLVIKKFHTMTAMKNIIIASRDIMREISYCKMFCDKSWEHYTRFYPGRQIASVTLSFISIFEEMNGIQ